jgi:hypothetical protein
MDWCRKAGGEPASAGVASGRAGQRGAGAGAAGGLLHHHTGPPRHPAHIRGGQGRTQVAFAHKSLLP